MFHSILQKIPFLLVGLSRVLNNGAGFLITLILVRLAGVTGDDLGNVQNALAIFTIISLISDFGVVETLQRYVNVVNPRTIISSVTLLSFALKVCIGLVLFGIQVFVYDFLHIDTPWLIIILIGSTVFNSLALVYNGLSKPLKSSSAIILYVCTLLGGVWLLSMYMPHPVDAVLVAYTIASVATVVYIGVQLYRDRLLESVFTFPSRDFFVMCASNTLFWISFVILTQTDIVFIHTWYGASVAGYFKTTAQIALFVRVLGLVITTPLLPYISKSIQENIPLRTLYNRILWIIAGMFAVTAITTFILVDFGEVILFNMFAHNAIAEFGGRYMWLLFMVYALQTTQMIMTSLWQGLGKARIIAGISMLQVLSYVTIAIPLLTWGIYQFLWGLLAVEFICWTVQFYVLFVRYKKDV